jgi:hypothetical protein
MNEYTFESPDHKHKITVRTKYWNDAETQMKAIKKRRGITGHMDCTGWIQDIEIEEEKIRPGELDLF